MMTMTIARVKKKCVRKKKEKKDASYNAWTMIVVSSIHGVSMSSVTICEIDMRSSPPSA